ncbi:alpha/beta hydrolase-fold protein [Lutimonas sp.]|uniref:alpha/beta hydrolase-fold protein n=1 Tax=Lutimonas sp. TaxID=1872403 RepID=UPI003D9B9D99
MINILRFITLFFFLLIFNISNAQSDFLIQIGLKDSIQSNVLNETRDFYVELPDSYVPGSDYRYPVVYILDGDVQLPVLHTIHSFYSGGYLPEMILVGVSNAKNRTRDLTTSKLGEAVNFNEENGEAENFTEFLTKELIPTVESKYPTSTYRTLIGHSYGGLFTINALLKHSEYFENYLAIDPSLDWDNQKLLKESKVLMKDADLSKKSLFLSIGGQLHMSNTEITIDNVMADTTDMTMGSRSKIGFSKLAEKEKDFHFYWKFYPNDLHGTVPLPSIMDGLLAMFEWYQMENVNKFNDPEATVEELTAIIKHREKKLHDHFGYKEAPYPDFLFNMKGYMSMEMGQNELAKMYFTLNTEYYPNDANSYDSLADYYESQKENDKALENVMKAYELSKSDYHKKRVEDLKAK